MEEEPQTPPLLPPPPATFLPSTVDTSRPFSSVKEAVAVFGQKLLAQEIFHSSPNNFQKLPMCKSSPKINPTETNEPDDRNDQNTLVCTVKRLEAELEATKTELKLLKEKEEDTEVAVASLNAELHKNMSKIAKVEAAAAAAAKAAVVARTESIRERERERKMEEEYLPTMAQILGGGEEGKGLFGEREKERGGEKVMNKKQQPIVPLVWKLFSRRKGSSTPSIDNSLFSSTHVFLN